MSLGAAPALVLLFVAAAAIVWYASVRLSASTDLLSERWRLGDALAGLLLMATVEDLPEVVIVVSGALSGRLDLITGNLLGGIAAQTVILVAVDGAGVVRRPLSYRVGSLQMVLVGLQGIAVFGMAIMATQLPGSVHFARLDPGSVLILVTWLATAWLIKRGKTELPWRGERQDALPREVEEARDDRKKEAKETSTGHALAIFLAAAAAILAAGYALEESSSRLADRFGINGVVFGATILAFATALPEFSTGYTAAKSGDFELAVSEVFGSNTFLPVLFLPAAVISGRAVFAEAGPSEVYLTGLGIVLTTIYLWGLLFRPRREYWRLGPDSIAVLAAYLIGIGGLFAVAGS